MNYIDCQKCKEQILNRNDLVVCLDQKLDLSTFHENCWSDMSISKFILFTPLKFKYGFGYFSIVALVVFIAAIVLNIIIFQNIFAGRQVDLVAEIAVIGLAPLAVLIMVAIYFNAKRVSWKEYESKLSE